jgi:hypothetical protein
MGHSLVHFSPPAVRSRWQNLFVAGCGAGFEIFRTQCASLPRPSPSERQILPRPRSNPLVRMGQNKVQGSFKACRKIKIPNERLVERHAHPERRHTTCSALFSVNIVRYAAFNLSQFAERSAVRGSDFAGKVESFSEHLLLLRFRSVLSRMKSNIPGRIEASVSKGRPFVAMTTSHTLLKERMFFLEKLEHALG